MENSVGSDSLYYAVAENNYSLLNELLENGGDVDTFYEDTMNISSKSLLHICCEKGAIECLQVMIRHGAQLDVRDKWGQTPLMYSVKIQYPEIVKILLEVNADLVSCQDRFGKASLHSAVEVGNLELVQMLLRNGADVNIRNHDGFSPLMICCKYTEEEHLIILKELLSEGALVDLTDYRGRQTALHIAVQSKNIKVVELLITAGSNVNDIDKTLRNPLTHAVFLARGTDDFIVESIVSLLISAGADLNVTVTETCNPLLVCAQFKASKLMKFFLTCGANPNVKFPSGLTPALLSASGNDLKSLQLLIQHNCDLTIQGSVYKRRRREEFHLDPFQLALMEGHLDACILMILSGYPLNQRWRMEMCQTCLSVAFPEFDPSSMKFNSNDVDLPEPQAERLQKLMWISAVSRKSPTLKNLCIFNVRSYIKRNIVHGISKLPVPLMVKDAIALKYVLDLIND